MTAELTEDQAQANLDHAVLDMVRAVAAPHSPAVAAEWICVVRFEAFDGTDGEDCEGVATFVAGDEQPVTHSLGLLEYASTRIRRHIAAVD